jgi:hypothetical protein
MHAGCHNFHRRRPTPARQLTRHHNENRDVLRVCKWRAACCNMSLVYTVHFYICWSWASAKTAMVTIEGLVWADDIPSKAERSL